MWCHFIFVFLSFLFLKKNTTFAANVTFLSTQHSGTLVAHEQHICTISRNIIMNLRLIFFSAIHFLVSSTYGMEIESPTITIKVVDNTIAEKENIVIEHKVPVDTYSKFSVLKNYANDAVALSQDTPPTLISLQDIQEETRKHSGLSIEKAHIERALHYIDKPKNVTWDTLGQKTTAAALFLSTYFDLTDAQLKHELSDAALETGYVNTACAHLIRGYTPPKTWYQRCREYFWPSNAPKDTDNPDAIESLITLIENTQSEKLSAGLSDHIDPINRALLYDTMYSSPSWYTLQNTIAKQREYWFIEYFMGRKNVYCDEVCTATENWRKSRTTRLYDSLHRNSIGREACALMNMDYTGDFKTMYETIIYKNPYDPVKLPKDKTLSAHDFYLIRPGLENFDIKRYNFTHLPLQLLAKQITDTFYSPYEYNDVINNYYHCDDINDLVLCKADTEMLKTISNDRSNKNRKIISFRRCNLTKLPPLQLSEFPTLIWYFSENPLDQKTKDAIKNEGYAYPVHGMVHCQKEQEEKYNFRGYPTNYLVKSRYWKWLITGKALLYTACIAALIYDNYTSIQECNAKISNHLLTRTDEVTKTLTNTITAENAGAYRFALTQTTIDSNIENMLQKTLNTLDPVHAHAHIGTTPLTISPYQYADARKSIHALERFWQQNSSPEEFSYFGNLLFGSLFFYWTAYSDITDLLWDDRGISPDTSAWYLMPWMILNFPFLLPEMLLGLNKPQYQILID
jgi:hypothetical protein